MTNDLKNWKIVSGVDFLEGLHNDGKIVTDPDEPYIPINVSEIQENILMKVYPVGLVDRPSPL